MEETISLLEILEILKKRLLLILCFAIVGTAVGFGVTKWLLTPLFSAEAELIVLPRQSEEPLQFQNIQSDINGNLLMLNTYKDMIKGRRVLGDVSKVLKNDYQLDYPTATLQGLISVVHSQNSQVFQIKAVTEDPADAAVIANVTAQEFKTHAHDMLDVSKVNISSEAVVNPAPVSPNHKLNAAIGLTLGLMLGIGLAFLLELIDGSITSEDILQKQAPYPVLGTIERIQLREVTAERQVYQAKEGTQYV